MTSDNPIPQLRHQNTIRWFVILRHDAPLTGNAIYTSSDTVQY